MYSTTIMYNASALGEQLVQCLIEERYFSHTASFPQKEMLLRPCLARAVIGRAPYFIRNILGMSHYMCKPNTDS